MAVDGQAWNACLQVRVAGDAIAHHQAAAQFPEGVSLPRGSPLKVLRLRVAMA